MTRDTEKLAKSQTYQEVDKRFKFCTQIDANSWWVQSIVGNYQESFFVTITSDNCIIMTGDHGGLIVKPGPKREGLVDWMYGASSELYFASKCTRANTQHTVKRYNPKAAKHFLATCLAEHYGLGTHGIDVINKAITTWTFRNKEDHKQAIMKAAENDDDGAEIIAWVEEIIAEDLDLEFKFYELIHQHSSMFVDLEDSEKSYTPQFRFQHACLLKWAEMVKEGKS